MQVRAEQLATVEGKHGVREAANRLVLVEDGSAPNSAVSQGAAREIGHGDGDVRETAGMQAQQGSYAEM